MGHPWGGALWVLGKRDREVNATLVCWQAAGAAHSVRLDGGTHAQSQSCCTPTCDTRQETPHVIGP